MSKKQDCNELREQIKHWKHIAERRKTERDELQHRLDTLEAIVGQLPNFGQAANDSIAAMAGQIADLKAEIRSLRSHNNEITQRYVDHAPLHAIGTPTGKIWEPIKMQVKDGNTDAGLFKIHCFIDVSIALRWGIEEYQYDTFRASTIYPASRFIAHEEITARILPMIRRAPEPASWRAFQAFIDDYGVSEQKLSRLMQFLAPAFHYPDSLDWKKRKKEANDLIVEDILSRHPNADRTGIIDLFSKCIKRSFEAMKQWTDQKQDNIVLDNRQTDMLAYP